MTATDPTTNPRAYRIEFTIQSSDDNWRTVDEVGFGSTASADSIDDAAFEVHSLIQNGLWETP